jgi:hypothetical protein
MKPLLTRLNNQAEYDSFIAKESGLNKVILFTEKNRTSIMYKSLSMNFVQRLHFAEVVETPETNTLLD